jgi:hypothetical protein
MTESVSLENEQNSGVIATIRVPVDTIYSGKTIVVSYSDD